MKRIVYVILAITLAVSLTACAAAPVEPAEPAPASQPEEPELSAMYLKIACVYEDSFLGMGVGDRATSGELYFVPTRNVAYPEDKPLAPGMLVTVFYDGSVQETYPATLGNVDRIAFGGQEDDLIGMYVGVLTELYETDTALNDGISVIACDFSKADNMMESEKAALTYLIGSEYGMEMHNGTHDELRERGYISEDGMYFPEGILFTIDDIVSQSETGFTFSAEKWRGGTGAIGMSGIEAELKDGVWKYTPGGMWIS